jgi:hypothetical protein
MQDEVQERLSVGGTVEGSERDPMKAYERGEKGEK